MEDVTQYIKRYWIGFAFLLLGLFFIIWGNAVLSDSSTKLPTQTTQQSDITAEILALQKHIETLQQQVSILEAQIKSIDSLRLENARNTPNQPIRSHYGELSRRYANDERIK